MNHFKRIIMITIIYLTISPVFSNSGEEHADVTPSVTLEHIHSVAFYDGTPLIATHHGLKVFHDRRWEQTDSPEHDYMGFSLTEEGFYASGHPDHNTSIKDPMGIMWSEDMGRTLIPVAYYGELDFHWLTAGYNTDSIFAYTSDSTDTILPGFYYSTDKGVTWQKSALQGVSGKLFSFLAHPQIGGAVFMTTNEGVFLSFDNGNNFFTILKTPESGALSVSSDGNYLFTGLTTLTRLELSSKKKSKIILPDLDINEKISNIAVSPKDSFKILIVTDHLNIFMSEDGGSHWDNIFYKD